MPEAEAVPTAEVAASVTELTAADTVCVDEALAGTADETADAAEVIPEVAVIPEVPAGTELVDIEAGLSGGDATVAA